MNLLDLVNEYIKNLKEANKLIEEKKLIEKKVSLAEANLKSIKQEISTLLPADKVTTFTAEIDSKQSIVQIDTNYSSYYEEFMTFVELTPIEELEQIVTPEKFDLKELIEAGQLKEKEEDA